jgi:hypothetical protein
VPALKAKFPEQINMRFPAGTMAAAKVVADREGIRILDVLRRGVWDHLNASVGGDALQSLEVGRRVVTARVWKRAKGQHDAV